jgi:hypothetical protein
MNPQDELNFGGAGPGDGYNRWLTERQLATIELGRRLGLPIGHDVEVWLVGSIRLRGKLQLQEDILFIEEDSVRRVGLRVDNVPFTIGEMESCVRLD